MKLSVIDTAATTDPTEPVTLPTAPMTDAGVAAFNDVFIAAVKSPAVGALVRVVVVVIVPPVILVVDAGAGGRLVVLLLIATKPLAPFARA